ncbi:MAG: ribonucleotide-diphosphate reductase subunit beta [Alphaproteobacteria bacterium]|nr:ribonucleotide-diphosphate reductase subunit beta [Alphaproteobacteria bacterium]
MLEYSDANPFELQGKGLISLLETSGAYNIDRYPWAYECWKRQQQIHWMGEEVPLGEDIKDWQSETLTTHERNLLTQIFRFFTQADVEVSENYFRRYIPVFQPLEIQMMMAAFTNIETVHIDAYALLLKTLGMAQTEFEVFRDYAAMRAKIDYMQNFGMTSCANVARTLAMFGAFTEGMWLFASFAMLMNFPRYNKMKGMGQIVTWSIRDESLHCESIIKLYHEWAQETGAVTQSVADDIIDVAKTSVSLEDKFIELAFELGDVEGMALLDIKNYVRYIADWRLTQLKLTPVYGYFSGSPDHYTQIQPHPLPWLTAMLNGVEHANFFEARSTEYSKAATQGNWHGVGGAWTLFDTHNASN